MKRRTKQNIGNGQWPNMRADTLKQISGELVRARKKHPQNSASLKMAEEFIVTLREAFTDYESYAVAATVAAMAIRCMEEGSGGSKYRGNTQAPDFKLTVENDRAN
jgi:hypothetical protein